MRKESATIRRCHSQLSALGLDSDAVFHRSKLILKIYRDVVWVLSERVEEHDGFDGGTSCRKSVGIGKDAARRN